MCAKRLLTRDLSREIGRAHSCEPGSSQVDDAYHSYGAIEHTSGQNTRLLVIRLEVLIEDIVSLYRLEPLQFYLQIRSIASNGVKVTQIPVVRLLGSHRGGRCNAHGCDGIVACLQGTTSKATTLLGKTQTNTSSINSHRSCHFSFFFESLNEQCFLHLGGMTAFVRSNRTRLKSEIRGNSGSCCQLSSNSTTTICCDFECDKCELRNTTRFSLHSLLLEFLRSSEIPLHMHLAPHTIQHAGAAN